MLVIFTTDGHEVEWHIGEAVPEIWGANKNRDKGLHGHELEHIQKLFTSKLTVFAPPGEEGPQSVDFNFPSLPMPNKQVCRWYGDLARTVYLNL